MPRLGRTIEEHSGDLGLLQLGLEQAMQTIVARPSACASSRDAISTDKCFINAHKSRACAMLIRVLCAHEMGAAGCLR